MPGEYDALLGQLDEVLAKALPGAGADTQDGGGADTQDGDGADTMAGDLLSKSFAVTLPNGEKVDAYDGLDLIRTQNALLKALTDRVAALEDKAGGAEQIIGKLVPLNKALTDRVAEQADLIKALRNESGGRKSVITAPAPRAQNRGELLAKALGAAEAGRISYGDAARVETCLNERVAVPDDLMARINAA